LIFHFRAAGFATTNYNIAQMGEFVKRTEKKLHFVYFYHKKIFSP